MFGAVLLHVDSKSSETRLKYTCCTLNIFVRQLVTLKRFWYIKLVFLYLNLNEFLCLCSICSSVRTCASEGLCQVANVVSKVVTLGA